MFHSPKIIRCGLYDSMGQRFEPSKVVPRTVTLYELEFFLNNAGVSMVNGEECPHKRGNILLAKPGDIRSCNVAFKTYYIHFEVDDPLLREQIENLPGFFEAERSEAMEKAFLEIFEGFYSVSVPEQFAASARLVLLLCELGRCEKPRSGNVHVLNRARRFIERSYGEKISVRAIAAHCNISETHLYRIFKNTLALSPNEYLLETRLSAARRLLCYTDRSMNNIALDCGFGTQSYFSDCFKRKVGISPIKYREMYQYRR